MVLLVVPEAILKAVTVHGKILYITVIVTAAVVIVLTVLTVSLYTGVTPFYILTPGRNKVAPAGLHHGDGCSSYSVHQCCFSPNKQHKEKSHLILSNFHASYYDLVSVEGLSSPHLHLVITRNVRKTGVRLIRAA